MKPNLHTVADWQRAYQEGATPQDLLPSVTAALSADDPAWIHRCTPAQLAAQLAALPPRSEAGPLWGVPFAVKDNIDVAGWPTTAACPAFAHTASQSATVVERLCASGAVLVGKTNLDQFATGLVGTRSPYGEVPNTFDAAYVSGGSSSGSASAVARGLVAFALGTDTAGSGRVPAGLNNLVGLKPTPGRVPMAGVVPACRSVDVVSVFALTVADAAAVMAAMEGLTADEPRFNTPVLQHAWLGAASQPLRLGVPVNPGCDASLQWDAAFEAAKAHAQALNAQIVPLDFSPLFEVAELLYDGPWVAERWWVVQELMRTQPEALDATVRKVIDKATLFDAADAFDARYRLETLRQRLAGLWQQVDALMVPTTPTCPTRAAVAAEPVLRNSELGRYTNFVNLLGWSALALPASVPPLSSASGAKTALPFGVTFIAPGGADAALADWGQRWETSLALPLGAHLRASTTADRGSEGATTAMASAPTLRLAVVGAHLEGMPLHSQLRERGCRLLARTRTAPHYRLFALPNTTPPKPGLARVGAEESGHAIELEVVEMPLSEVGSFLAAIPAPLGLGTVELEDGSWVKGFICEPHALAAAKDISAFGGWRAYVQST